MEVDIFSQNPTLPRAWSLILGVNSIKVPFQCSTELSNESAHTPKDGFVSLDWGVGDVVGCVGYGVKTNQRGANMSHMVWKLACPIAIQASFPRPLITQEHFCCWESVFPFLGSCLALLNTPALETIPPSPSPHPTLTPIRVNADWNNKEKKAITALGDLGTHSKPTLHIFWPFSHLSR